MKLLLVEDDGMVGESLQKGLKAEGYSVDWAKTAGDGSFALETNAYDIMLLDLGLPDYSGIELLQIIRQKHNQVPTIILTAKDSIQDRVGGLDAGADDYLVKPFSLDELLARLRALLRRKNGRAEPLIEHNGLILNPKTFEAILDNQTFKLSTKEFAVLMALIKTPGAPLSKGQLEAQLYGWEDSNQSNTIEVFIHSLRRKLGQEWIKNIRGLGYFIPKNPRKETH
ncbi:response regulator [Sulfuricurvum sp.]|uniref:response regulator n=1 Tax=Sulfuricurvum sp. TaxID=2025608 RepID=UPI0026062AF7|nr:response regulator [Sulfuricurvum sp.]MDD2267706.1 response regulator [Sulfuricurvum sp.]MDD2949166.1 response regulator [Sulfuricurvum sp.]